MNNRNGRTGETSTHTAKPRTAECVARSGLVCTGRECTVSRTQSKKYNGVYHTHRRVYAAAAFLPYMPGKERANLLKSQNVFFVPTRPIRRLYRLSRFPASLTVCNIIECTVIECNFIEARTVFKVKVTAKRMTLVPAFALDQVPAIRGR